MALLSLKAATSTATPEDSGKLSEADRVALYRVAPIRQVRTGENVVAGVERCDSFFVVSEGSVQVFGVTDMPFGSPLMFTKGDCIGPIAPAEHASYFIQALEASTVLEISPKILSGLSDKLQVWVYRTALKSYDRAARYLRSANQEIDRKNRLLSERWRQESLRGRELADSELVQKFIAQLPKLPTYTTEIAAKLMDPTTSVHEVSEAIKRDPALAGIVLRCVNSAQYSFGKKIETFYHACMILGFNNIYQLLLKEGVKACMRDAEETRKIHLHSCLISTLCYEVASLSKDVMPQTVTTIGLLHDIGRSVLAMLVDQHAELRPFRSMYDTAKIGADLVKHWGLPERIWQSIQCQDQAEFMPPDAIESEYRKEVAVLYVSHMLEGMLHGEPPRPERMPFMPDYLALLKMPSGSISEIYQAKVLPSLVRNKHRLPPELREMQWHSPKD